MKKVALACLITLTISTSNAFPGSQLIQKDYIPQPTSKNRFLDAADEYTVDEYSAREYDNDEYANEEYVVARDIEQNLEEYDQINCDTAQPQKPSAVTALFTEVFGFMLMRYLSLKEMAQTYCHEIKELINKWFSSLNKA